MLHVFADNDGLTVYNWGDGGTESMCTDFFAGKIPSQVGTDAVGQEALRRIGIYCRAVAGCIPRGLAAAAAGIILDAPPDDSAWGSVKRLANWVTSVGNTVDYTFINVQLGIVGGQNVMDAAAKDWKNASESGAIAKDIEAGRTTDALKKLRDHFSATFAAAGVQPPSDAQLCPTLVSVNPNDPKKVNPGTIRQVTPLASSSSSTGTKVAVGTAAVAGGAFIASAIYAAVKKQSIGYVWDRIFKKTKAAVTARRHP